MRVFRLGVRDAYEMPGTVDSAREAVVVDVPLPAFTYAGVVYAAELACFDYINLHSKSKTIISFEQTAYQ